jgi:hypothetical protein
MTERELRVGTPEDNYQLEYCRKEETIKVLECLSRSPVVFVHAQAGNGKTSFGVEIRERIPEVSLIMGAQLGKEEYPGQGLYDNNFEDSEIIVVDEFDIRDLGQNEIISDLISKGKSFVFLVHYPKNRFLEWRKQHQERFGHILRLINDFPSAPWMHLKKYKNQGDP